MLALHRVGVWVGTSQGLVGRARDPSERRRVVALADLDVRELALTRDGVLLAGAWGGGLYRSADGGRQFSRVTAGLPSGDVTALFSGPDTVYAGFEPPGIATSADAGETWEEVRELRAAPGAAEWTSPWGSADVSAILADGRDPRRLYVGIEVGGVYLSTDRGQTFDPRRDGLEPDVHALAAHPGRPDALWAATRNGVYRTDDAGCSWNAANEGLDRLYTPAIAVSPRDPDLAIAAPARAPPGRGSRLHRTEDGGERWRAVGDELAGVERRALAFDPEDTNVVYAGDVGGALWISRDTGLTWETLAEGLPPVHAVRPARREGRMF